MKYGSDHIAEVIAALGIPFVALNPGASFRGLHDSLVNYETGKKMPELIECTHEEISVAIAHGYAKATGKIMACALHNTVGLQHAAMAIFNAWCDRVPILLLGGSGPSDVEKRRPWIDWIHTALVQGNQIRDYVKFDDQPSSIRSVTDSLYRAYRLALTQPAGPVYVCFDAALQEEPIPEELLAIDPALVSPPDPQLYSQGRPPAADPAIVDEIAEAVRKAEFPLIITDHSGRSADAFYLLGKLAETWGIPVIDHGGRLNLPTNHPMNLTIASKEALKQADVVIALDMRDLFGSVFRVNRETYQPVSLMKPGALLYSVGLQDYGVRSWSTDFQRLVPTTANVLADSQLFLAQLLQALGEPTGACAHTVSKRRREVSEWHGRVRREAREKAERDAQRSPIALSALAAEIWKAVEGKPFVLANGNLRGWTERIFDMDKPFQYLGPSGGAGLGYGIGATIGAALAHRDTGKLVIDIQADGDLMYTPGGLWTLAHHQLPALIIMNNNRTYYNSEEHQTNIAKQRGRQTARANIGTTITDPEIDFVKMAESMGVKGIGPIAQTSDLGPALKQAIEIIEKERVPVLVDVITEKAGYDNAI
jgi:thiamine pyrophosphate-dependent acetolactate synthase large subunit-like protein